MEITPAMPGQSARLQVKRVDGGRPSAVADELLARIQHVDRSGAVFDLKGWTTPEEGRRLELFIVSGCNIDCSFCCENQRNRTPKLMPWDELERKLVDAAAQGVQVIQFMGGEPTLHRQFPQALARARELGMRTYVITNLLRWQEPDFAATVGPLLDEIMVSVHAVGDEQGAVVTGLKTWWSRFSVAVENLQQHRPQRLRCATVLSRENQGSLEEIAEMVLSLAPHAWVMGNPVPVEGSRRSGVDIGLTLLEQRSLQPRLQALHARCTEQGTRLVFFCFPHCVLGPDLYDHTHEVLLQDEDISNAAPASISSVNFWSQADYEWKRTRISLGRTRGNACHSCSRKDRCGGYFSAYFDQQGEQELIPFGHTTSRHRRRFHAFGVGLPKTGSTSLSRMFAQYRTHHEYRFADVVETLTAWKTGALSEAALRRWLLARDAEAQLELEVSTFSHFWVHLLPELFPWARFLCPVRDPYTQVESFLRMMLRNRQRYASAETFPDWQRAHGRLMVPDFDSEDYVSVASIEASLPRLVEGYLHYWSRAMGQLLAHLPRERTLFVHTRQLSTQQAVIADFLGVDDGTLSASHENRAPHNIELLTTLPQDWLDGRVQHICGPQMAELFPNFRSSDAFSGE